jgi:hypothetical protein
MSEKKPTTLTIQYEDGSSRSIDFTSLPTLLQSDILRQPFALDMAEVMAGGSGKHLLLEWEDGWREVYGVDASAQAITRYYVVSRNEDVGRVAVAKEGYPDYIEISRRPLAVRRIALGDSYALEPVATRREGKKTEQFYELADDEDLIAEVREEFFTAAAEEGFDPAGWGGLTGEELRLALEATRQRMKLVAGLSEQDALSFLMSLLGGDK